VEPSLALLAKPSEALLVARRGPHPSTTNAPFNGRKIKKEGEPVPVFEG